MAQGIKVLAGMHDDWNSIPGHMTKGENQFPKAVLCR